MMKSQWNDFQSRVLEYLTLIPRGKVVTYGQIAAYLGNPRLCRAVGSALHRNPDGNRYPCYKVVSAAGKLSDRYAFGGISAQAKRLRADGVTVTADRVDLSRFRWRQD